MEQSLLRLPQVIKRTGICRSGIYAKLRPNPRRPNDYDPTFPKPVRISTNRIAWVEAELNTWIEQRINLRDKSDQENRHE